MGYPSRVGLSGSIWPVLTGYCREKARAKRYVFDISGLILEQRFVNLEITKTQL